MKLEGDYKCPYCSIKLDGIIETSGEESMPKKGDYTICFGCENVLRFKKDGLAKVKLESIRENYVKKELDRTICNIQQIKAMNRYLN